MGKAELSIDADLLAQAEAVGIRADAIAEAAIRTAIAKADPEAAASRAAMWAEENAEAIAEYNRRIRERGLIGDEFRQW